MHAESVDPIKLFDKEVNAQKESLQIPSMQGSCKLPQAHKKCVMKMKDAKKKNNMCKNDIAVRNPLITKNRGKQSQQASSQQFWTQ